MQRTRSAGNGGVVRGRPSGDLIESLEPRTFLSADTATGLVPTSATLNLPATVLAGAKAGGTVKVTLTNTLATTETGHATLAIYASTSTTLDTTADPLLGTVTKNVKVAPGKSIVVTVSVKSLAALPEGTFYVIFDSTDSAGNDISGNSPMTLTVSPPVVTFSPVFIGAGLPLEVAASEALKGSAKIKVTNNGNVTSPGPVTITLTASTVAGVVGTTFSSHTFKLAIKPGKSAIVAVPLGALPESLPAGNYYTVAEVTDPMAGTSLATSSGISNVTGILG